MAARRYQTRVSAPGRAPNKLRQAPLAGDRKCYSTVTKPLANTGESSRHLSDPLGMMCSMTTTSEGFKAVAMRLDEVLREFASLDVDRTMLEQLAAGPALVCLLSAIRPELLDADAQLSFVAAAERGNAWLVSVQQRGMVAFAGSTPRMTTFEGANGVGSIEDVRRTELAAELRWSEPLAHQKLTTARILTRDLPQVARASAQGAIPESHTRALADGAAKLVSRVDDALGMAHDASMKAELQELRCGLLAEFERRVVPFAQAHDLASTRRKVRDTLAALDPQGAAARRAKAQRDLTDVTILHDDDGMSTLTAVMPSEQASVCLQAIDGLARSSSWADASLPIGVRRADALLTLLTQAARGSIHAEEARPSACECGAVHARPAVQLPRLPRSNGSLKAKSLMTIPARRPCPLASPSAVRSSPPVCSFQVPLAE